MAEFNHTVKIIFLGDFMVNKKTILQALRKLPADSEARCLSPGNGIVEMLLIRDGKRVRVKISDTGGQERFRSITSSFYRGIHGCLLLFDVTQKSTFDSLHEWQRELYNHTLTDDVVLTLVGCDATDGGRDSSRVTTLATTSPQQQTRQVSKRLAQDFAAFLGGPYREIKVRDVSTIVQTLGELVDRILTKASRVPELSTSITPLEQRMENMQKDAGKGKGKAGGSCSGC
ncbi:hypothetical protein ACOMHN_017541 [Nucella lapillus]